MPTLAVRFTLGLLPSTIWRALQMAAPFWRIRDAVNWPERKIKNSSSPQAANDIRRAEQAGDDAGGLADRPVSSLMAQGVVDIFEVVKVHDEQGAVLPRPHLTEALFDAQLRSLPVQQAGERVLEGALLQLLHPVLEALFRLCPLVFSVHM